MLRRLVQRLYAERFVDEGARHLAALPELPEKTVEKASLLFGSASGMSVAGLAEPFVPPFIEPKPFPWPPGGPFG